MLRLTNRLGIASLVCCAAASAVILALILVRQWRSNVHFFQVSDWAGEYLWIIAPYIALALATAVAWRSRFFSTWVLACVIVAIVANPALYFLFYLALGGRENESNTWTLFVCPVLVWNEMAAFLVVAVIVRLVRASGRPSD